MVRDFSITNAKYCTESGGGMNGEGGSSNLEQIAHRLSGQIDQALSPKKKLQEIQLDRSNSSILDNSDSYMDR